MQCHDYLLRLEKKTLRGGRRREKEKEEILKSKIEEMKRVREMKYQEERKQANKSRQPKPSSQRAGKRQKIGENEYREKRESPNHQ